MPALPVVLGAFASFSGFLFGYDTGYIAGCKTMVPFLKVYGKFENGEWMLPTGTDSLLTSILSIGTCLGALLGSTVGDRIGRRWGIIFYIALFAVGVALQTACKSVAGFAVGRVFAGLGVGGTSCLVPIYQAECAPKHLRGLIVSAYQFFITLGLLVASCVVYATKDRPDDSSYRIPIGVQFVWGAIIIAGTIILPESPRWLILKDKDERGRKSIARLLGKPIESDEVQNQYAEIRANLDHERNSGSGSWADCLKMGESKTILRIATGMGVQALQQLSGINFIMYYGTQFFQNTGIADSFLISIAVNSVNSGMTIPGMIAADRLGRRTLMMYGAAGMAVGQFVVASIGVATSTTNIAAQRALVAFVCVYIAHFASTWGTLAWVITSETYPYEVRTKGMSLSTATQWLFNFAIGYVTPYLVNSGPGNAGLHTNVFWIWGGCCCVAFVFSYFCINETKGLSLEQVDLLIRKSTPRTSNAYRKVILQNDLHDDEMVRYATRDGRPVEKSHPDHFEQQSA